MADKKISELVNLTSLATDDEFVVVDKGANATKRITATNLSKFPAGVTVPDGGTIGSASDPDAMSIASGGVVTFSQGIALAAGKGISFAAQTPDGSGTVGSEVLDDYEEGTWTPVYTASTSGTQGAGTGIGAYTKIGNTVICWFLLARAKGTLSGDISISGLPFAVNSSLRGGSGISFAYRWNTDMPNLRLQPKLSTSEVELFKNATNADPESPVTDADMINTVNRNNLNAFLVYQF